VNVTDHSTQTRDRAEAKFKKLERAQDGAKARTEYEAEAVAVRARTVHLRSLRLAKEAADGAIEVKKKPVARTRKSSL
jgi:hypothetical protein